MAAGWLDRIEARSVNTRHQAAVRKSFSMPPFWSVDGARVQLLSASSFSPDREAGGDGFEAYARTIYKRNGIIFSCSMVRARVFSQARFQFQRLEGGRPTDLFNNDNLRLLERPWTGATTGMLLAGMEVDASLAGNHFTCVVDETGRIGAQAHRDDGAYLARMRPDWVTLIIQAKSGNPFNVDARVVALSYAPPGMEGDPLILTRKEFSHYAPIPDPEARFRGMSWLTPTVREVQADSAYTTHKTAFLRNGATPNLVVKMGDDIEDDDFQAFVAKFRDEYEGAEHAYKTLFVAGGADVVPLSVDFKQLDLKAGQGALETRIASAAGVHPTLAGLSEGLAGSSLNDGNFTAARRLFVDSTVRDLWSKAAPAMEVHAAPPGTGVRLWYDARDIPFLREDAKDEAETFFIQVQAARMAVDGGWEPDAAVEAAEARDVGLLIGRHTGKTSVQLHDPNAPPPKAIEAAPADAGANDQPPPPNGKTNGHVPTLAGIR